MLFEALDFSAPLHPITTLKIIIWVFDRFSHFLVFPLHNFPSNWYSHLKRALDVPFVGLDFSAVLKIFQLDSNKKIYCQIM